MPARRLKPMEVETFEEGLLKWSTCNRGYKWQDATYQDQRGKKCTGKVLVALGTIGSVHQPLTNPFLFRELAQTPTTPEGILAFANKYGELGIHVRLLEKIEIDTGKVLKVANSNLIAPICWDVTHGEIYDDWVAEIKDLNLAIQIWEAAKDEDEETLLKWIIRTDELEDSVREKLDDSGYFGRGGQTAGRAVWHCILKNEYTIRPILQPVIQPENRILAAKWFVVQEAQSRSSKHFGVYFHERTRQSGTFTHTLAPRNLIGAAWWQLSRIITGEVEHKWCQICGKPIEVSSGKYGGRRDRQFCSAACKQKDHRQDVKKAKEMRAQGKTISEIARHFVRSKAIIENWLKKTK